MLSLSEKVKVLDLIRKEKKSYARVSKIYGKNESSVKIVKKEKETCAGFAVGPQTVKVKGMACDKYLVKMAKALNLLVKDMNRRCVPIDGNVLSQRVLYYVGFGQSMVSGIQWGSWNVSSMDKEGLTI